MLQPGQIFLLPYRKNIKWVGEVWTEFKLDIVDNFLTGSDCTFEGTADYSAETGCESDVEL